MSVPSTFPVGTQAKIAIIAEAPSHEEIVGGRPLIGPSGRTFNHALEAAGIDRSTLYIANVFSEKADDNDVGPWMKDPAKYEPEFARLAEELDRVKPNVIVPMGQTALWAFTGETKITNFRGAVTRATRIRPGAKLLPTLHPSMVIKQYQLMPTFVGDLIKVTEQAKTPKIEYPQRRLYIEPTLADVKMWREKCLNADLLSVDIETSPKLGLITCIGFAPSRAEAMCIPFMDMRRPGKSYWPNEATEVIVWKVVREILESPVPKLGQNFMYDYLWLWEKGPHILTRNYLHDTRLLHHALYPELPKDLATMSANYTDIGAWKSYGGHYQSDKRDN